MSSENIKNKTEAVKNILVSLAVVIGGLWSFYVFDTLNEEKKSEALLIKLEQDIIQRPVIKTVMTVNVHPHDHNWLVIVNVKLQNSGKIGAAILLDESSIGIARVIFENGKISTYENHTYSWNIELPTSEDSLTNTIVEIERITLLPGQNKEQQFIFQVENSGVYQIQFRGSPSEEIMSVRNEVGIAGVNPIYDSIALEQFVIIGEDSE